MEATAAPDAGQKLAPIPAARVSPTTIPAAPPPPLIMVPPSNVGTWYGLADELAPWLSGYGPTPVSGATTPTRAAGLQASDGHWLAIVIVQRAPCGGACADPGYDMREDDGRLNMRWNADFDHWLEQQHVELYRWIQRHGWVQSPRSWISYRVDRGGEALQAHALVAPSLIEPATRNNNEFLAAGRSGALWARQFADATQEAAGGTALKVPPFPYGTLSTRTADDDSATDNATPPAHAVQDRPAEPEPVRAPRQDRQ